MEVSLQKHDLYAADEFFVTGTGAEVMPVTKIDGRVIADGVVGPITRRLTKAFHELVRKAN
jgi:branched-chain amino acid aminotransferase